MQETLLIDGHVHIYPNFDFPTLISNTLKNAIIAQRTSANRDDAIKVWLLTERHDTTAFDMLAQQPVIEGYTIHKTKENESLLIKNAGTKEPILYIIAGRQIITKNNLEICCLCSRFYKEDRLLSEFDLVQEITKSGGIPTLNWAPGKWFGQRGKLVRTLMENLQSNQMLISDTSMRPTFWATPKLMIAAEKKGFKAIAGSDPLPFDGEEKMIATYASIVTGEFDYDKPAASIKKLFLNPETKLTRCGKRSKPIQWLGRQTKIMSV
jgi:hypothetical protein